MATAYIMANPRAGRNCGEDISALEVALDMDVQVLDITLVKDWKAFLAALQPEDALILAGGDGTLVHFLNDTEGLALPRDIRCFPLGTGNDFAREFGRNRADAPFPIRQQLERPAAAEVEGKTSRFLNGVGFGIDGYCALEGERLRAQGKTDINYTAIAIQGLLKYYRPTGATVTVDGVEKRYEKVWLAPAMLGKYYGGGMIPTPGQSRDSDQLSVMVFHGCGKLKALAIFPGIFKGTHIRHKKNVEVLRGREIRVVFDEPRPLQIDGEVIPQVRSYRAVR